MTITSAAKSLIPGNDDRAKMLATLGISNVFLGIPIVPTVATAPQAIADVEAQIESLLLAGKQIPADIGKSIHAAEMYDAEQNARAEAIDSVVRRVDGQTKALEPSDLLPAYEYLADELTRVVAETRKHVATLNGATTAQEAISGGPAIINAWKALGPLAVEYNEIRAVQKDLTKRSIDGSTTAFTTAKFERTALFADSLDVHPAWTELRETAARGTNDNNRDVQAYGDWLRHTNTTNALAGHLEPEQRMILLVTTTIPWLPTPEQFEATDTAATSAVRSPNVGNIDLLERARVAYYDTAGIDHDHQLPQRAPRNAARARIKELS